jgi:hypothetical protein
MNISKQASEKFYTVTCRVQSSITSLCIMPSQRLGLQADDGMLVVIGGIGENG